MRQGAGADHAQGTKRDELDGGEVEDASGVFPKDRPARDPDVTGHAAPETPAQPLQGRKVLRPSLAVLLQESVFTLRFRVACRVHPVLVALGRATLEANEFGAGGVTVFVE